MFFVHLYGDSPTRWASLQSEQSMKNFCAERPGTYTVKEGPCMNIEWARAVREEYMKNNDLFELDIETL